VRNIAEITSKKTIISTAYHLKEVLTPNNDFLRLKKKDKLLKYLLEEIEKLGDNVKHGETGPLLLEKSIFNEFPEYKKYLTPTEFIGSINYYDYEDFLIPSSQLIKKLNIPKIFGFHIWNTMFRENKINLETINNGFYYDLKEAILTSKNSQEYFNKLKNIFNLNNC